MATYNIMAVEDKVKLKEINLDCFGIKKIQFEKSEIDNVIDCYLAEEVELTEEQVQYLKEHDFIVVSNS